MANKKQEPQSVFGCIKTIAFGYLVLILLVTILNGRKPNDPPSTLTRVMLWGYTIAVVFVLCNLEYKKPSD